MKVFINPGHDKNYDSGAVNPNTGIRECDIAAAIGDRVAYFLEAAGCEVQVLQSDNLYHDSNYDVPCVCDTANNWPADIFVSIHCNAANCTARGTEVEVFQENSKSGKLGLYIQNKIVGALGTIDRGIKERPELIVLKHTYMPAVLVEMAFIDNDDDAALLTEEQDEFAAAIARGITDYEINQ